MSIVRALCILSVHAAAASLAVFAPAATAQDPRFDGRPAIAAGTVPTAFRLADIDGDGDPDAIIASAADGTLRWRENNADIDPAFPLSHAITAAANAPRTIEVGDLDRDGDLDVAAAISSVDGRVLWYANDGAIPPVFTPQILGPAPADDLGQTVNDAVVADLDGDGLLDVIAGFWVNAQSQTGHVTWYRQVSAAPPTFVRIELASPPGLLESIESIEVADLDGDNDLDIAAVARPRGAPTAVGALVVWVNPGGTLPNLVPQVIDATLVEPVGVAAGLLDGDALPDLVAIDRAGDTLHAYRNLPGPPLAFTPAQTVALNAPSSVVLADTLGDARPDAIVASDDAPLILESTGGTGIAFARVDLPSADGPSNRIDAADIDQDGDLDIAASHPGSSIIRWTERVAAIENIFSGDLSANLDDAIAIASPGDTLLVPAEHFVRAGPVVVPPKPIRLEVPDPLVTDPRSTFHADDLLQLAAFDHIEFAGPLAIDDLAFVEITSPSPVTFASRATSVVDGTLILQAGATVATRPAVQPRSLDGGAVPLPGQPLLLDQPDDVATVALADGTVAVAATGLGPGGTGHTTPAGLAVYTPSAIGPDGWLGAAADDAQIGTHRALTAGDLDGDGDDDLLTVFTPSATGLPERVAHVSDGMTPPTFTRSVIDPTPTEGPHLAFDINRDGLSDIVTSLGIYRATAPLMYVYEAFPLPQPAPAFGVGVTDLNGDGSPDVVTHIGITDPVDSRVVGYELIALINSGGPTPSFVPAVIESLDRTLDPQCLGDCYPSVGLETRSANSITMVDLTKDMHDELVIAEDAGIRVLERLGPGPMFVEIGQPTEPSTRWARVAAIDLEGDGDTDLAYASPLGGRVALLETTATSPYAAQTIDLHRPTERASGIAAADVNGDDRPDLAIVGQGFDRVAVLELLEPAALKVSGPASSLSTQAAVEHIQGEVTINGGTLQANDGWTIRDRGTIRGTGTVQGDLTNLGRIELTDNVQVNGTYMQSDPSDPTETGDLRSELISASAAAQLLVQFDALLAGGFRLDPGPLPTIDQADPDIPLVSAVAFSATRFDAVALPRVPILTGTGSAFGVLQETYSSGPTGSTFAVGPRFDGGVNLGRSEFCAIGTPADGVLFDLTGPGNTPDGIVDIAIAYPQLDSAPRGGIAVFMGMPGSDGVTFQPVGVYTGKNADHPVAVEAGDFDADGQPEIAFGNLGSERISNTVHFLSIATNPQNPVVDAQISPLPFEGDRRITDLARLPRIGGPPQRGPVTQSLVVLNGTVLGGVATIATYDPVPGDWDSCDIDVCDDPDSVDPIDVDGALVTLATGIVSTSQADDKVTVAFNTGGMPDTYPTQSFPVGADPGEVRSADLDGDGFPDIATVNATGGSISILINVADAGSPGGRSFADASEFSLRADPGDPDPEPNSIAIADLDDDGDLDLAVVSTNAAGDRAVRTLENLLVPNGTLGFATVADLDEQPVGVPLLVRETDAEMPGTTPLNDDLVVLVDPEATGARGPCIAHELFTSSAFCRADVNRDGEVTDSDFFAWVVAFLNNLPEGDVNGDGFVTDSDFFTWVTLFLKDCP